MSSIQDVVDIEEFAKAGKRPPEAAAYRIRIDKTQYVVRVPRMSGRELLALAGKLPVERFKLFVHLHGGKTERVDLDESVSFTTPGVERFKTLPIDSTDGLAKPRRHFRLPESDEAYLDRLGLQWDAIVEAQVKYVIIYALPLPKGYNVAIADVALRIDPQYPVAQIDMAYFSPELIRKDGRSIAGLSSVRIDGRDFQQWSRHRTSQNPWRPGIDDIESHLNLTNHWLDDGLSR